MDEDYGSIEHESEEDGHLEGLCPLSMRQFRLSDRRWITSFHHRHGMNVDPVPFGVVDQIFN